MKSTENESASIKNIEQYSHVFNPWETDGEAYAVYCNGNVTRSRGLTKRVVLANKPDNEPGLAFEIRRDNSTTPQHWSAIAVSDDGRLVINLHKEGQILVSRGDQEFLEFLEIAWLASASRSLAEHVIMTISISDEKVLFCYGDGPGWNPNNPVCRLLYKKMRQVNASGPYELEISVGEYMSARETMNAANRLSRYLEENVRA